MIMINNDIVTSWQECWRLEGNLQ